jgi:hypothetical protein
MRRAAGGTAGRFEVFVVLTIAVLGIALAALVVLAPWHPNRSGRYPATGEVVRLDSPDRGSAAPAEVNLHAP